MQHEISFFGTEAWPTHPQWKPLNTVTFKGSQLIWEKTNPETFTTEESYTLATTNDVQKVDQKVEELEKRVFHLEHQLEQLITWFTLKGEQFNKTP